MRKVIEHPKRRVMYKDKWEWPPRCVCGEVLQETENGWMCPVHGLLDGRIQQIVDAPMYEGLGEAW